MGEERDMVSGIMKIAGVMVAIMFAAVSIALLSSHKRAIERNNNNIASLAETFMDERVAWAEWRDSMGGELIATNIRAWAWHLDDREFMNMVGIVEMNNLTCIEDADDYDSFREKQLLYFHDGNTTSFLEMGENTITCFHNGEKIACSTFCDVVMNGSTDEV